MQVALGISGGIAAYKACEIVRGLDRAGVQVQVVLTAAAARFVTPLTLETLSRRRVLTDTFDPRVEGGVQHIEQSRSVDALVVAPATANVLAKFAGGIADDLLSTFHLAVTAPVLVAPAMNTRMWFHPATRRNVTILRSRGVEMIGPDSGWLAEQEHGVGRMSEPEEIVEATLRTIRRSTQLAGKKIVVSAGPTHEAIDPVRFLANRSSGKMGYALGAACARRGARVVLVSGPVCLAAPHGVEVVQVSTSAEMRDALHREREGAEAVFMAAAVADYVPDAAPSKIKKSGSGMTLVLHEGPDILAEMGRDRKESLLVGFAAETDDLLQNARGKLERKNLDFIVANDVSGADVGFGSDDNAVTIVDRDGTMWEVPRASKTLIADAILDRVFGAVTSRVAS